MYGDILGRAPDTGGKDFYVEQLTSGQLNPNVFQAQVAASPEATAKACGPTTQNLTQQITQASAAAKPATTTTTAAAAAAAAAEKAAAVAKPPAPVAEPKVGIRGGTGTYQPESLIGIPGTDPYMDRDITLPTTTTAAKPAAAPAAAAAAPARPSIYAPGPEATRVASLGASHLVNGVQVIPGAPGYDETKAIATLKNHPELLKPDVIDYLKSKGQYDSATERKVNAKKESDQLYNDFIAAANAGKVTEDQIKNVENQINAGANEGVVLKNALANANVQTAPTTNIDARKTEAEALVKSTFGDVLNRQPLQGGLDYWTNRLLNNEISAQDLSMYIAGGATGDDKAVADAWLAGQTGAADPTTGLTTDAETTEDEIAKKRGVAEAIVNSVFRTVLKRDPLEDGLNYWVERLMSGEIKPSELGQYVAEGATGDDKVAADRWLKSLNPETNELTYTPAEIPTAPTATGMDVAKIGTPDAEQLIGTQEEVAATDAVGATAATAAQATAPTETAASTISAVKSKTDVDTAIAGNQAITGTLSSSAQATAAETKPAETAVKDLEAAKLANPREVIGVPERTLQAGELVSGPSVNMSTVDAALNKAEAATAAVKPEMTIQGQLDKLLADFDSGNPPAWAASSLRNANAVMAARGMGASSLAGQAIVQATLEAAVPIAAQDAQTVAALEMQNLSNRQQVAVLVAQQRAAFLGQEFDQEFQTRVTNAARVADIANLNFTAEQTIALENARLAQTVDLANLSNDQALVMARAAQVANLESANLNNRQQAALQNAQAFLQLDLTNLNNEQQTALFNTEKTIQSILTDTAAENAAKQFNATSEMQVQQFYDSLVAQVSQFNTSQTNALRQFNVSQENALSMFNAEQDNAVAKFNAQNRLIIDQSNAEWRRNIATVDTAAQNTANQFDAQAGLQITMAEYNNQWQNYRDIIEYAFTSTENALNRNNTLAIAVLQKEAAIEAAKGEVQAAMYNSLGRLSASVIEGSGGLAGTVKAFTDAGKGIADIFGLSSKERDIIAGVDFLGDADIQGGYDFYGNPIDNSATAYLEDYWGGSD